MEVIEEPWPIREFKRIFETSRFNSVKFRKFFALDPLGVCLLWSWQNISKEHEHLLWMLFFLKNYPTKEVGASFFRIRSEDFLQETVWKMIIFFFSNLSLVCFLIVSKNL